LDLLNHIIRKGLIFLFYSSAQDSFITSHFNEVEFASRKFIQHINDGAMEAISPRVLFGQIMPDFFDVLRDDITPESLRERINCLTVYNNNVTLNFHEYLNLNIFNFQFIYPTKSPPPGARMLEIMPYEY